MEEGVPGEWEAMQRDRFRRLTNNAAAQTNRRVASEDNGKDIIGAQEIQTISVNLCPNSLLELSSKNAIVCAILNA
jgi:hypothetical protein